VVDPVEYDSYFVPAVFEPWSREVIKRAQVWKGDRVLDVACGTGIVACRIAGSGAKVTAIDLSPERIELARARAADENVPVTFSVADATAMRFAAGSFDLVTCQQGLQFFADRAKGAKELRRVIASGGRAVISCWRPLEHNPVSQLVDTIAARHFGGGYGGTFTFGDEAALKQLLLTAKFMVVNIEAVTRLVKWPDPARFVTSTLTSIAAERGADAAKLPDAIAETTEALAPHVVDGVLEMMTASLIAVGRVSAK
jgi:ubiquinone/menaquinone biosynthesis C-methylase UbiE